MRDRCRDERHRHDRDRDRDERDRGEVTRPMGSCRAL
jgi:hypothetical protein